MATKQAMRLKAIPRPESVIRVPMSFKASTAAQIDDYREHYRQTYGHTVERSTLVESMLLTFMQEDKGFQAALAEGSLKNAPTSPSEA